MVAKSRPTSRKDEARWLQEVAPFPDLAQKSQLGVAQLQRAAREARARMRAIEWRARDEVSKVAEDEAWKCAPRMTCSEGHSLACRDCFEEIYAKIMAGKQDEITERAAEAVRKLFERRNEA
jgi:hypothetical protein